MKVLQINNYNYLKGGSEKVYQVTIELLQANGHQVRYFSTYDSLNEDLCPGTAAEIVPWRNRDGFAGKLKGVKDFIYNSEVARQLDDLIKEFHPDVAHLHIFYGNLSNAVIDVLRKNNIPIVQSVHEYRLLCPAYTCLNPQLQICESCAGRSFAFDCVKKGCVKSNKAISLIAALECFVRDRFCCYQNNVDAFIMVSKFIENLHIKYFPEIQKKCHQIYNSIDYSKYKKYQIPFEKKSRFFLYLGRLSHEKGIKTLIEVFSKNPSLSLKIAGTGPLESELKSFVDRLCLTNVDFLGFLSGDDLYNTIAESYYVITPSEWYENNPLSIIESLALGTPVIGSNIGGIPELIIDGHNGFLHEPKQVSSLEEVLQKALEQSNEGYVMLSRNSMKMAEEMFDNSVYYKKLIDVYTNVIKRHKYE